MKKNITNYAMSVRTRLLNLMNRTGYKYMYLIARYFNERLLYRVAVSKYKEHFLLKGGSLLYAINGLETRPTIDVDFMACNINRQSKHLEMVFRDILSYSCVEDGVLFDLNTLTSQAITVDAEYPGTRLHVTAHMDTIVYPMTIDIGFDDVVTPSPTLVDYPILLDNVPEISIWAYSIETVIAEKFHTMIVRDVFNSRMKDYFDCYQILLNEVLDESVLYDAVKNTFDNRKIPFNPDLNLFTDSFFLDPGRQQRWSLFLKKIQWKEPLAFKDVMMTIKKRLQGFYDKYWTETLN